MRLMAFTHERLAAHYAYYPSRFVQKRNGMGLEGLANCTARMRER